jgi:hypothetical protein
MDEMDGDDWKDGSQSEETRHVNVRFFVSKTNCTGLKATTTHPRLQLSPDSHSFRITLDEVACILNAMGGSRSLANVEKTGWGKYPNFEM